MNRPPPPRQNTDAEMQAFDATCDRLSGFDGEISTEWVDGFLSALAAAPRPAEPDEWLPAMFGDTFGRVFADPEDHERALQSLRVRLAVLRDQLDAEALFDDPEALRINPWMSEWTDEHRRQAVDEHGVPADQVQALQTGAIWAEGFLDGIEALPGLWAMPEDEEAGEMFGQAFDQIAALLLPPDSDEWKQHVQEYYQGNAPTRDDLITEACMSVQDLRMFWVDFAPKPETRRVEATPGRNDPCPCGSGRKYKKCHGAAA